MVRTLIAAILFSTTVAAADAPQEAAVKFALYSAAWGENTDDDLRIVVHNRTTSAIHLERINFLKDDRESISVSLELGFDVPASGFAESELPYVDLLTDDECVERSMADRWKLTEISNYTLNPSVRNLIIQDTDSFRIYQCVQNVETIWIDRATQNRQQHREWVLYHFESRQD